MISAIWIIARKELLENILSLRYQVSSLLCLCLVTGSALLCVAGLRKEMALQGRTEMEREKRLNRGIEFAEVFQRPIPYQKRPSPVAVFASGLEPTMTRPLHLQRKWWSGGSLSAGPASEEAPVFRLFTRPDLVYIVAVILSLLAFIAGHDAISREREGGTLKLLLSCGPPRFAVILGKALGGFISVMTPLVLSLLTAALVQVILSPIRLTGEDWNRLMWIAIVSGAYVSAFLFLGIFISCIAERSATSLIVGLFAWTLLALILPHIGPIIARKSEPVETASQVGARKRAIASALRPELYEKYRGTGRRWQTRHMVEREISQVTGSLDQERRRATIRQLRFGRSLSRFSPAGAFIFATTEASGTGVWSYLRFVDEAQRLAREFDGAIEGKFREVLSRPGGRWHDVFDEVLVQDDLPVMNLEVLSASKGISEGIWETFALGLYAALFCMGAFLVFMRSDVV